ncbi:YopX family protein [Paenisporosarcina cavernae]|uniref:YopX protein domain-containing protein n=1 Tax=Paenisporosarcina cavernae TaxID=2320858 RepID=A0A385YWH1_9BACL|nr:YopX family protein [Paenisporosarcina cavernae]AYC30028.1 hypothetical protein D3873_09140 [Paenisporosarcina cavernae]
MRQIKFRVWDKDCKSMHVCGTDVHDAISFDSDNLAYYYNLQNGEGSSPDGTGTYALMQYTGLQDKNGVEIYEGDIVSFVDFDTTGGHRVDKYFVGVVKYQSGIYEIWNNYDSEFYGSNGAFILNYVWLQDDEFEVIGNIYRNKNLLEESQ